MSIFVNKLRKRNNMNMLPTEEEVIWAEIGYVDGLRIHTQVWVVSSNPTDHVIAVGLQITDKSGFVISTTRITFPLETFEAMSKSLLGKAIGRASGSALNFRQTKEQLCATLQPDMEVLRRMIADQEYTAEFLAGDHDKVVALVREMASLSYMEIYDREQSAPINQEEEDNDGAY